MSNRLVTHQTTTTEYMKRRLNLPSATVIPLGFTPPHDQGPPASQDPAVFTLVYVGRLIAEKGVDVAIRAVAEARRLGTNVRLEIVGDGQERSELEQLARRELPNEAVSFVGAVGPTVAIDRMRAANAVIVPSVWGEPAGYVVLEAMAAGVPVIAADRGGIPETARGAAILVKDNDVAAYARALATVASNPVLARNMRHRGKAQVRSGESMADEYLRIYARVLKPTPR
jgi:glycosyltransferase involved in cell wall biosynthesis